MAKDDKSKDSRPQPRLPKGMRDVGPAEVRGMEAMLAKIRGVYELYGFEPLATSAIEFTDALGKFLPDQDRPNAGVFSFQDEDGGWMSLRYDLTAPLARYVAENFDRLPKPYRRYQVGSVWRNEKPGPGRFREFVQFDADTVGTDNVAADAEICMMAADALEALGVKRGQYVIRVNNRKMLDGVLEVAGVLPNSSQALVVMRAMDKFDKFGADGVRELLGKGRKDESGDFTKGAGLADASAQLIVDFLTIRALTSNSDADYESIVIPILSDLSTGSSAQAALTSNSRYQEGKNEVDQIIALADAAGFQKDRIRFDPSVVRGLEYYTGPVFEAELTFEVKDEDGRPVRFGSVGGGGRYDGLVSRFTGQPVPAVGFSIGVSRLYAALQALGKTGAEKARGPVLVLVMDKTDLGTYQALASKLRAAGIAAEMYVGTSGMKPQMKYADKRGSPCVVIQGGDEKAKGEVTIKDLIAGAQAAAAITGRAEWTEGRPAQISVPEADMVKAVQEILARHGA